MADDLAQVPVGLNWSVAQSSASTTWSAVRSHAPGYEVVMEEKGGSNFQNPDNEVLVPLSTAQRSSSSRRTSIR